MSVGKNMQACFMLYVHCMAELLYIDWRYEDMIKVIASDMDGTLLCDDHRIAPDTIAAVKEACAAGIRFMVATGRGYEGAMAEELFVIIYWEAERKSEIRREKL
jgi:hypothetical protein